MILYKYYSDAKYNFEALLNENFFFSKTCKLNDPFDASFQLVKPYKLFLEHIKEYLHPEAENIMGNYGTCSFSEQADNKHLWALYANSYKGFVIGYDKEQLEKIAEVVEAPCPLRPVEYVDALLNLDDLEATFKAFTHGEETTYPIRECFRDSKIMDKLWEYLCFVKEKKIWSNEQEWRLFAGSHITQQRRDNVKKLENGYLLPIPQHAIKEVIIGHNMDYRNIPFICNIAHKYEVEHIGQTQPNTDEKDFSIKLIDALNLCKYKRK